MPPLSSISSLQVLAFRQEYEGCSIPELLTAAVRCRNEYCRVALREILNDRRQANPAAWKRHVDQLRELSNEVLILLAELGNPFANDVLQPALN